MDVEEFISQVSDFSGVSNKFPVNFLAIPIGVNGRLLSFPFGVCDSESSP
jgi:hypothetical protein